MMQSGFTAALGLRTHQNRLDNTANNLANVSTTGYKAVRTTFKDALYENMTRPVETAEGEEEPNLRKGNGVLPSDMNRNFGKGVNNITGGDTDFFLDGDGFFVIQTPQGVRYTRDGTFHLSVESEGGVDEAYLVTAQGYYVLDMNGQRIKVSGEFIVSQDGSISADANLAPYAQMAVVRFDNQKGLMATQDNLFAQTTNSGEPIVANELTPVLQGSVEMSNVDMANEMTMLIRTQKAYAFAARCLTMADEMDGTANNIRA